MTLREASKKQYTLFAKLTTQQYKSILPWEELPYGVQDAWMEIVRTCPRKRKLKIELGTTNSKFA